MRKKFSKYHIAGFWHLWVLLGISLGCFGWLGAGFQWFFWGAWFFWLRDFLGFGMLRFHLLCFVTMAVALALCFITGDPFLGNIFMNHLA